MRIALIQAHPLPDSLTARFADRVAGNLSARRHHVERCDLYAEGFAPVLTPEERRDYYTKAFADTAGLAELDGLVLVFPTWWFGMPAILKGWIDRSFLPGVAYRHNPDGGALHPNLPRLRAVMAVTTLGSPAFYDHLIMRRPVYRALRHGVIKACAPKARFRMLSLYRAEQVDAIRLTGFETRLDHLTTQTFPTEP